MASPAPALARALAVAVAVAVAALAVAACRAPDLDRDPADGGLATPCVPFADLVVEWKPAGGDNDAAAGEPALGAPDGAAVALGVDTVLTVAFTGLGGIIDADGPDLGVAVAGEPAAGVQVASYTSIDGLDYAYAGELTAANTTLDLAVTATSTASYLRLVGLSGELPVDAIEALQTVCPAAASVTAR